MAPSCLLCILMSGANRDQSPADPYAPHNLLHAGTLAIRIPSLNPVCDTHNISEEYCLKISERSQLQSLLPPKDVSLVEMLVFLVKHYFILARFHLDSTERQLVFTIFLIPYDLAHVQGKLRARNETLLASARKYLKTILPLIMRKPGAPFLPSHPEYHNLAQIYNQLPSPCVIQEDIDSLNISGMRSNLYLYQCRSVAAMLRKETRPEVIPDPLFVPIIGLDGREFYIQPATSEVLRERPLIAQNRGGILCEELGTGKTVMILALILATLNQLSSPEESIFDVRPVMTPLSSRIFPSTSQNPVMRRKTLAKDARSGVPSLVDHLLHFCRVAPDHVNLRSHEDELQSINLWEPLVRNTPYYLHRISERQAATRQIRKSVDPGPKRMYLTSATLILVPPNLLAQWDNEIQKHCAAELSVFVKRDTEELPRASVLASNYDIILMSHGRFSLEASKRNHTAKLHSWSTCECPTLPGSRVPDCRCDTRFADVSPLLQVRWKRLVIDEGHITAKLTTQFTTFAQTLSVERRWIVTGTPTANLLGLTFGQGSQLQYPEEAQLQYPDEEVLDSLAAPVSDEPSMLNNIAPYDYAAKCRNPWSDHRGDLRGLATMMTHFLEVPQFHADTKTFDAYVINPLLDQAGPRPGSIEVLQQVMESVMIRHRAEDVEEEVLLPILNQETILLDFDPYSLKTYNVMQAAIAINAIDSQRKDQDYLFHSSNVDQLILLMKNLSQMMFWHIDDELFHVDEMVEKSDTFLSAAHDRNSSPEDVELLKRSLVHIGIAASDEIWRRLQDHTHVFHRTYNIPEAIYSAWQMFHTPSGYEDRFLNSDRLVALRNMVLKRPLATSELISEWGYAVREEDLQRDVFHRARLQNRKRQRGTKADPSTSTKLKAINSQEKSKSPEKLKELGNEWEAAKRKLQELAARDEDELPALQQDSQHNAPATLGPTNGGRLDMLASSPVSPVRIGNSTSAKLNYILREVLGHSPTQKFLIFSNSPLTLNYVAEGLDLAGVKYFQFSTSISIKLREQYITTFETSDTYRVFLMELAHAARGLNLVSASRVIFCEPVWQADVESQAIKRVHRIGQTRPVTVKTLAIRGTFEEQMMLRKEALKSNEVVKVVTDDMKMRDFIANPTFLTGTPVGESLDISLLGLPANPVNGVSHPPDEPSLVDISSQSIRASSSTLKRRSPDDATPPPPPKKKRVTLRISPQDIGASSSTLTRRSPDDAMPTPPPKKKRVTLLISPQNIGASSSTSKRRPDDATPPPPPKKKRKAVTFFDD